MFPDIVYLILLIFMIAQLVTVAVWRISCFFKKTCKWKSCPYRRPLHTSIITGGSAGYCPKFPPTEEELAEEEKFYDELLKKIPEMKNGK